MRSKPAIGPSIRPSRNRELPQGKLGTAVEPDKPRAEPNARPAIISPPTHPQRLRSRVLAVGVLSSILGAFTVDRAQAACGPPGVTVNCTGNESGGVSFVPAGPIQNLNVNNLTTAPIAPGAGTSGIIIDASGGGGSSGGFAGDGGNGTGGGTLNVTYDGSQSIFATGSGGSGIVALSNGGNGGNGGNGAILNAGDAGNGAAGGSVTINAAGMITVQGPSAAGIVAQSSGGMGGIGGDDTGPGNPGDGGHGGSGGSITIINTANIASGSAGIIADSIGGSGGRGGSCGVLCFGTGGGGPTGFGGTVSVTSSGTISTTGPVNGYGIFAQSVGGAGGAGGSSTILYLAGWAAGSQSGGDGGTVTVQVNSGSISTTGAASSAIYAQSVGGGGGAGGTGIGLFYAQGGSGTVGGSGNKVTVTNFATLHTTGDQSSGIFAQSVGGGGGAGGTGGSPFFSFGGVGGNGENGGIVEVHNHGNITVSGNANFTNVASATLSTGIFAQSVGGGGGDGGIAVAGLGNFGGTGGAGGDGNTVSVENTATIMALCGASCSGGGAIFAQSVGGGGGNGGSAFGVVALGGSGGGAGEGQNVTVNNSGALTTTAQFSAGIFAQAVGGGGGNGAFAGGIAAIGGSGGEGGNGHTVTVNNAADITTGGADSGGIFAQSIGGGGGNGGGSVAVGLFVSFALGGEGGSGGNGGTVCVNTSNSACSNPLPLATTTIRTTGDRSTGILAQSVGGGGGNGGFAVSASVGLYGDVSIGVGGKGAMGGSGGDVFVGNSGQIITGSPSGNASIPNSGQFSDGIDAESIGGGGGNGGFSVSAGLSTGGAVSAALGGNGGAGNHSGQVTVNTQTSVTTYGDQAVGIFARSIGGGGGNGGFAVSVGGSPYASVALSFGGTGGGGGPSDQVHVDNVGSIHTFGAQSNGISAQSIGGGGGNGGFSASVAVSISSAGGAASLAFGGGGGTGGTGALVHVSNQGDITTEGAGSVGILAQSVGGGGGNGGFSGAIAATAGAAFSDSFGGGAGGGNRAGPVDVTSTGNITTLKDNATGIVAQSIGGGGGNGGFSLSVAASLDSFAIGKTKAGDAGDGGVAGDVTVISNGTIQTGGSLAYGVLAQSIGGGGGNGGFAISGAFSESASATGNSVGGNGGKGNNGGAVTVTTNPTAGSNPAGTVISTTGIGAVGILAQSIGGGGGNGGFAANLNASIEDGAGDNSVGATGAAAGGGGLASNGGTVTVNNNGTIMTTGATAHGILAQSVGGGGGNGGFAISGSFSDEGSASSNAIGGKGGTGGTGGQVIVNNLGDIHVGGDMANGIVAQSVGGGGGNGGFSISAALSLGSKAASNSVGGAGGNGGASGEVDVNNSNVITVGGVHGVGILAQSIGGGGGNGGFTIGAGVSVSDSNGASDSVGGTGGLGGGGGVVKVTTFAGSLIVTSGAMDNGIQAQSIGGGGGNGGFAITGSFSSDGDAKSTIGGSQGPGVGGGGGGAMQVTVDNAGGIDTKAFNSIGVLAQSIGGGGGSGGFAASAGISLNGAAAANSVGGSGGNGGDGAKVVVINEAGGVIHTEQANSIGISAQSIGGGGGNGGFAISGTFADSAKAMSNSVGGSGGNGGGSGEVDVSNHNIVQVDAAHSIGILAQSIGGGGGNGGFAIGAGITAGDSAGAADTVGGSGGGGGAGGVVNVFNFTGSQIFTNGMMDFGIVAQSIGGGGGNGGFTLSGSFSASGDASTNVGGSCNAACQSLSTGGGGGDGHAVLVDNGGSIITISAASIGIVAQSIGGGGGNGGFAGGLAISGGGNSASNAVGGSGGNGGAGGSVTVTNELGGDIHTFGANSIGILAQSIGGGGGNGGFAISASGGSGDGNNTTIGGSGGAGGTGGTVTVKNLGTITTEQVLSAGIVAQSIGGGGGNGAFSINGTLASGSGGSSSSVGGSGGAGGDGGVVSVTNSGAIVGKQAGSVGILAQSIGGGGGNGGFSGALNISGGPLASNVGGTGGKGGAGGDVTVTSTGSITTTGANSVAVIAQSIGGGGGVGGFAISASSSGQTASADVSVGDVGLSFPVNGSGGAKGTVTVNISGGLLHTTGALSTAVLIQSIAGGGGVGGLAVGDPMTLGPGGSTLQVGAVNGLAGSALTAMTPSTSSPIMTDLAGAMGFAAQSIGGGGGVGQVAGDFDLAGAALSALVGGSGVNGGSGNVSTPTNSGDVTTKGDNAIALLAQSIGGGGGVANFSFGTLTGTAAGVVLRAGGAQAAAGDGMQAGLTTSGVTMTGGSLAPGVVVQSIGGGGGVAGLVAANGIATGANGLKTDLGSFGGPGGAGGAANVTILSGFIMTTGLVSPGVIAQSIGGGGGLSGFVNGGAAPVGLTEAVLGSRGGSGSAAAVSVNSLAGIVTNNAGSLGILAQSIGGGGGAAEAFGVSGSGPITIGASAGASGNGAAVTVTSGGAIQTGGVDAHAIVAQSIGGGGGLFIGLSPTGAPLAAQVNAASGGGGGNGDAVTVTSSAPIQTSGAGAFGIIAQSVGGGGGVVGGDFATSLPTAGSFAGSAGGPGSGGIVKVTTSAGIFALGQNGTGIFAESLGASGTNDITVTVQSGMIVGGLGSGHAVSLVGGLNNLIDNSGVLTTLADVNGMSITGGAGNDGVINNTLVIGSVDLDGGANAFDNKQTGIFNSGVTVFLGAGNLLSNEGLISPGAYVNVMTTNETGNFLQSATGLYGLDLDFLNSLSDRINVTGTASVTGTVNVNIMDPGLALPGSHDTVILSAAGTVTNHAGLALTSVPTAVAKYSLTYPDPNDIVLHYDINFSPAGLTINEHSVGNAVNAIQLGRNSPNFVPIAAALFYQPDVASLGRVYDSLSGEGTSGVEQAAFTSNDQFMNAARRQTDFWLSGATNDPHGMTLPVETALGYAASNPEHPALMALKAARAQPRGWRSWAEAYGGGASVGGDGVLGTAGLKSVGGGLAVGADYQANPDQLFGVAIGGGPSSFRVSDRATSGNVDAGHVAGYAATRWGGLYASSIVGYDFFTNKVDRSVLVPGTNAPIVPVPGFAENLTGKFFSQSLSARIEAGWKMEPYNGVRVTPFAALQYSLLQLNSFTETSATGPSVVGLSYARRLVDTLPMFLGGQIEAKILTSDGRPLTSWMRVAWVHEFEPYRTINPSFIVAPGFNFIINGAEAARDAARVDAGWSFALSRNVGLFTNFDGQFSPKGNAYSGSGGFKIAW